MLRVVIADDEQRVCKLIQALADWQGLGMVQVGEAANGMEALELLRTLEPDILITDIRMPGYSGLELIRRAKETLPALEVIIVSGYAQFDYAQTAIQYGVGEYLLKPVNKDALNGTLARMGERCRERRRAETDMENLRVSSRDDQQRLRESLIPDLLSGRFACQDMRQLEQMYHFSHQADTLQTFLLKMDYDVRQFQEPSLDIVRQKVVDVMQPILQELCGDFVLGFDGAAMVGVISYPATARDVLRARLREGLNQLVALTGLFGPVVFSMALAEPIQAIDGLPGNLAEVQNTIQERLTEGVERLLEGIAAPSGADQTALISRYAQRSARAVETLDADEADSAAQELEGAVGALIGIRGWELAALVRGAGATFASSLGADQDGRELADFQRRCGQCTTVPALFSCLKTWQRALLSDAMERRRNQEGQPIRLAKQYIQKHFAQPLTLEMVGAAIGFSGSYFSTLFKRETGDGFNKYLMQVRMEEARNLLRDTRLSVVEVCGRVGYADIKHFTRTFKATTGLTPGEFRKVYG